MKGLLGVMALLIVLATTAMLMGRNIRSAGPPVVSSEATAASGVTAAGNASAPASTPASAPATGELQRVRDAATRALEQAAAARRQAEEK